VTRTQIFASAAKALAENGVPPLLMRDDIGALDSLIEVDVLVPARCLDRSVSILQQAGWELLDSGLFHTAKRAVVLLHGGDLLKLDIHGEVIDEGLVYLSNYSMFEGASPSDLGFLIPRDEPWLVHVLMHSILGKTVVPEKLRGGVVDRFARDPDINAMHSLASTYGLATVLAHTVDQIVRGGAFDDAAAIAGLRATAKRVLLKDRGNFARRFWQKAVWPIGQSLGWRPGVFIAFIGPDGAGKSSTIDALAEHLQRIGIPVRSAYLGPWDRHILPLTRWLLKFGVGPCDEVYDLAPKTPWLTRVRKHVYANIKRTLYYTNMLLEIWARYAGRVWPHLALRRTVLGDRYACDLEVGHFNREIRSWKAVRRMVSRLSPQPDFLVLLDNDPNTIWSRKREYPIETINSVLQRYHRVAVQHGAIVVRTDRSPDEVAASFLETYWRAIIRLRRDRLRFWGVA